MIVPSAPVRVLIAGAGDFGREHLTRLLGRTDVDLAGVADPNPAALERVRSLAGAIRLCADPMQMIAEEKADAIIVATPVDSHVEICARALRLNLCVLLEKPVARTGAGAAELRASESASAGFVLPGHILRFSKDHQRFTDVVRSGRLGNPIYVNSRRYRDESHAIRYPDVDPILMTLIHDIDLAQWVTESAFQSVRARRSEGRGFRSMTATTAVTATEVVCDLRTAWSFMDGDLPPDRLEVVGERGGIELTVGEAFHLHCDGRRIDLGVTADDDSLRREHDHFFACVRDRTLEPAIHLRQALAGLAFADAAMESLRSGREVSLPGDAQ